MGQAGFVCPHRAETSQMWMCQNEQKNQLCIITESPKFLVIPDPGINFAVTSHDLPSFTLRLSPMSEIVFFLLFFCRDNQCGIGKLPRQFPAFLLYITEGLIGASRP